MSSDNNLYLPPDVAISVRNLSRFYMLFDRPQDRLKHALWRGKKKYYTDFWALRNIFLEVKKGESVGIIGRNGSGKSTLLQIIAGVLKPSEGEVLVRGRVSALLELGSGLNPELTGKENIYLTGSILGLSEAEINDKFDDIAAFADIGSFLNQPIKLYSSGMAIRLAYSVLAHLDPDILIIDEALAVGDVFFQLKCSRHIKKLIENGTTLLFVSHDPYTIKNLCKRSIWIHEGVSKYFGDSLETTARYQDYNRELDKDQYVNEPGNSKDQGSSVNAEAEPIPGTEGAEKMIPTAFCRLIGQKILDENNNAITKIHRGKTIKIRVTYEILREEGSLTSGVAIFDPGGYYICGTNTYIQKIPIPSTEGIHEYEVIYKDLNLLAGTYLFDIGLFNEDTTVHYDFRSRCVEFKVVDNQHIGDGLVLLDHKYVIL